MSRTCTTCRRSNSQLVSDAKALGLLQEFQCGVYTCCQIAEWADEQWSAWFKATQEDSKDVDQMTRRPEFGEAEPILVPVRLRRAQVPWFRNPDDLSRQ
jgi:hypothetical protein